MTRKNKHASHQKGDLVEDVVGLLHEGPGWSVTKKARVPVLGSVRKTAEIDVLISGQVAGYEVRIGIECKNWAKKIESGDINEFIGKLDDVGIPRSHGVFVSAKGYTQGAIRRAVKEGIQPLELLGLARDRLTSAVQRAFRHVIYLVPDVELVQKFDDRANEKIVIKTLRYKHPTTGRSVYALDHLWKKWFFGESPAVLGLHHLRFDIPQDPAYFLPGEEGTPKTIFFGLRVRAAVVSREGSATDHVLRGARDKAVQKRRLFLDFESTTKNMVRVFDTEEALDHYLAASTAPSLTIGRIRLPRIIYQHLYWPPTVSALRRSMELQKEGQTPTFELVEGLDLSRAWEFLANLDELADISDEHADFKVYS